ncbi:MAG: biopolymer transporter ExbD [Synechococcales bacterium]|jgi:biopolymer transport protein ExbD|nr:biopolymer transporter ExbD [Cyanobacteria bacterium REEB444]MEB3124561.1 biopolymer transporter ExbD [Synechococcales bacterium]NBO32125.1 biopolymer transporter ExbD [Cyanobacteria bacterium WB6_1B_304]
MRLRDEEDGDMPPQINIVPMIDVIFAILTFFIMSTLFLSRTEGLPVNLPKASSGQGQPTTQIVVTIDSQGQLFLNQQPSTLEALNGQVQSLVGNRPQVVVIINADQQVSHGRVVLVMDQLRRIPQVKLAIATVRPQ